MGEAHATLGARAAALEARLPPLEASVVEERRRADEAEAKIPPLEARAAEERATLVSQVQAARAETAVAAREALALLEKRVS